MGYLHHLHFILPARCRSIHEDQPVMRKALSSQLEMSAANSGVDRSKLPTLLVSTLRRGNKPCIAACVDLSSIDAAAISLVTSRAPLCLSPAVAAVAAVAGFRGWRQRRAEPQSAPRKLSAMRADTEYLAR
eukprot:361912-Pleurochrysis_carterae.AAC.4